MNKIILSAIVFVFSIIISLAQNDKSEVLLINCIYSSYADEGVLLKQILNDFEKQLVKDKILEDRTGESYIIFLKRISNKEVINFGMSSSFLRSIKNIDRPDAEKARLCVEQIKKQLDSTTSKIEKLDAVMNKILFSDNLLITDYSNALLSLLTAKDFELDLYKLNLLYFFSIVNMSYDSGLERKLPQINENAEKEIFNLEKSIEVFINAKNQIFLDKKKVSIYELKKMIKDYELKNKEESYILLKNDSKTSYSKYIEVQNTILSAINSLRNDLSIEKFKKEFKKLDSEERKMIKEIYPINLRESS